MYAPLFLFFLQITKKRMKNEDWKRLQLKWQKTLLSTAQWKTKPSDLKELGLHQDESLDDIFAANTCPIWVVVLNDVIMHI